MNTIQSEWEDFEAKVMPDGAGPIQRQEMRRAFYSGVAAGLTMREKITKTAGGLDERAAEQVLVGLAEELKMFTEQVMRGEA